MSSNNLSTIFISIGTTLLLFVGFHFAIEAPDKVKIEPIPKKDRGSKIVCLASIEYYENDDITITENSIRNDHGTILIHECRAEEKITHEQEPKI